MWADNETELDYVNFSAVSKTIAEFVLQSESDPVSIGVSGNWGVGKSTMIRLTRQEIEARASEAGRKILFVEFNAWLYQGYDDARAALSDVVLKALTEKAEGDKTVLKTITSLASRINWLRTAKAAAPSLVNLMAGGIPVGTILSTMLTKLSAIGDGDAAEVERLLQNTDTVLEKGKSFLDPAETKSPPTEIQALRDEFEEILERLDLHLVVLVDDLDRCLPSTSISTLEAMRLFLFLKRTAFVIAADDRMIRYAVKQHFKGYLDSADEEMVANYFDKLIQIPLRVPPLGTQEVRAYMFLLIIEKAVIAEDKRREIRIKILDQLSKSWQGKVVDRDFVKKLAPFDHDTNAKLDVAHRLAPLMTMQPIGGNPRLIKRFMNAVSIRSSMAKAQSVDVDEEVLAKLLLFERLGDSKLYEALINEVTNHEDGHAPSLKPLEIEARRPPGEDEGNAVPLSSDWASDFHKRWLSMDPPLMDTDLRGALYIGREHAPILLRGEELSSTASDILSAILGSPRMASAQEAEIAALTPSDQDIIGDKILQAARREAEWGNNPLLDPLISIAKSNRSNRDKVISFFQNLDTAKLRPAIATRLSRQDWAQNVFRTWSDREDLPDRVRKAIERAG